MRELPLESLVSQEEACRIESVRDVSPEGVQGLPEPPPLTIMLRRTPLRRKTPMKRSSFKRKTHAEIVARLRQKPPRLSGATLTRRTPLKARGGLGSGAKKSVRDEVCSRDGERCVFCSQPGRFGMSHCFPRSKYKMSDRNEAWNLDNACNACHDELERDPEKREIVEQRAWQRRPKGRPIDRVFLPHMTEDEIEEWKNRTGGRFEHWAQ